jgi:RNA polymerase sigma factor for flagellar operon FliA
MPASSNLDQEGGGVEAGLWAAYRNQGSVAAREQLFSHHAAFARNIARRHFHERSWGDIDLCDLYQMAYMGLLESLDRFDPGSGAPFRAYAAHRISGSIRDGIVRMSEVREQVSWRNRIHRERMQSIGEKSVEREPIERLTEIVVGLALGFMLEGTGLFVQAEDEAAAGAPANAATAYDSLAWKELIAQLKSEMESLPKREHTILHRHYLEGVGFDDLARLLNISKGRVSQLHRSALIMLRKRMADRGHLGIGSLAS